MMNTKMVKELYEKTKAGELVEVTQLIKIIDVEKEVALNLLICASNACYNVQKGKSKVEKDTICDFLELIICYIDSIEQCHVTPYFQSVFHIIKYMCDQEWFEDVTKMEFVIIPSFLNPSIQIKEDCRSTYQTLINKLSNSIFQLTRREMTNYNKYVPSLIAIILKANSLINDVMETLSLTLKFLNVMLKLKFKADELCKFYFVILENFGKDNIRHNKDFTDGLPKLIQIFSVILTQIIKENDFSMAIEFLESVETRTGLYFSNAEIMDSHVLFKCLTIILKSDMYKIPSKLEDWKLLMNQFQIQHKRIFYNVIKFLEEPLLELLSFYRSSRNKTWCQFPNIMVLSILKFLRENICCNLINTSAKCSCGCCLDKNFLGALRIGCHISALLKYYLINNKKQPKDLYSEILMWQSYFFHILKKVKAHNCKKWTNIYIELGTYAYNIGTSLYHEENNAFVEMYYCFLKYSLEFDGTSPELLKFNLNESAFNVICEFEFKSSRFERCMAFAGLFCLLYPQKSNAIFQKWWIKSKIKIKEDPKIQQSTLVSVLDNQYTLLKNIVNLEQYLTAEKKIEMLNYELQCYKNVWRSKESIMAAFSNFIMIADLPKTARVVLDIFGGGDIQLHDEMASIFSKVIRSLQEYYIIKPDKYIRIALAVLLYYSYKDSSKKTADKNLEEMEKTMQVMESAEEKFEPVPKDPNDECDIISAYSNLRLNKFTDTLNHLNRCIDMISSLKEEAFDQQTIIHIPKLLSKIGFEYRLHCFSVKSIQSFELSLKYAKQISDNVSQLLSISFLIENSDTQKNYVTQLINRGDELFKQLKDENSNDKHNKTLAIYQISKVKAYLHINPNKSYESWKIADALVCLNETKDEFKFLKAELYRLEYKLTKRCDFKPGEHAKHPMTLKLHCALDIVTSLSHKKSMSSYELCILFDTVYDLAKVYHLMRLPRDLRAYSKNSVLLTQKLVLPIRCVSFLILLAHSDLLTCKTDHCTVKLNGVNDIFCLSQSRPILASEKYDLMEPESGRIETEIDQCSNQIQELALDIPEYTRQFSPSSPTLVVESFKAPLFLSHDENCICFICLCLEYQELLLQKYHLDALYNMYVKEEKLAEEFVHGAFFIYGTLNRQYDNYKRKVKSLISESLIPNFHDYFIESYANILYDYSSHLMRQSEKSRALKINTDLVQLLKPKKHQYVYLYYDALLQRLTYILPDENSNDQGMKTEMETLSKESTSEQKTPTSKKSTVMVKINGISQYSPPKRRIKKTAALFKSSSDTEETFNKCSLESQKSATPRNRTDKKEETCIGFAAPKSKTRRAVPLFSTPKLGETLTPKIQIFTDDAEPKGSVRKSRRKHPKEAKKEVIASVIPISEKLVESKTARKIHNPIDNLIETNDVPKENREILVVATNSEPLSKRSKESSLKSNTSSMVQKSIGELLADKNRLPLNSQNTQSSVSTNENSSLISGSPENHLTIANSKQLLEKIRASAGKSKVNTINSSIRNKAPEVKRKLLMDSIDNEPSTSKSIQATGTIRKSMRNRVI